MSKSYRKPYSAITGHNSAAWDKMFASRSVRRSQDSVLRNALLMGADWDEVLIPHRYECQHNDVWSWGRDGVQKLQMRDHNSFNPYAYQRRRWDTTPFDEETWLQEAEADHAKWIAHCSRK